MKTVILGTGKVWAVYEVSGLVAENLEEYQKLPCFIF